MKIQVILLLPAAFVAVIALPYAPAGFSAGAPGPSDFSAGVPGPSDFSAGVPGPASISGGVPGPASISGGVPARSMGSPGAFRPISPGASLNLDLDDSPFASISDFESSPQITGGIKEGGVRESPQKRPDFDPFESGVGPDRIVNRECDEGPANLQIGEMRVETVSLNPMCPDPICGAPCPLGNELDANGCKTCKCIKGVGLFVEPCPSGNVDAIWTDPSDDTKMTLLYGDNTYTMSEFGEIEPLELNFEQTRKAGRLCGNVDAAFTTELSFGPPRTTYSVYFSGDRYSIYQYSPYRKEMGVITGPHSIHESYEDGNDTPLRLSLDSYVKKIDAAYVRGDHIYFFFKNPVCDCGYYAVYDAVNREVLPQYPRRAHVGYKGMPVGWKGPDAAYYSKESDTTYLVVDNAYYEYNGDGTERKGGPRPVMDYLVQCPIN